MLRSIAAVVMTAVLAACGGGGGSAGTTSNSSSSGSSGSTTTTTTVTATVTAASFVYQLDKTSINNSGTDGALLTVTALDSNNNPVSGVALAVAVDSGIYTPVSASTDAAGQASGRITIGSNKTDRRINSTITMSGKTATAVIAVAGSAITLTPLPATPSPGQTMTLNIKVADSAGTGISGASVQLSGTLGFNQALVTDSSGSAVATLGAAPNTAATYSVIANASGVTASQSVQVVVPGSSGAIADATSTPTAASISITPNTIAPNASGSTTNRANIRAVFQNSANQAIQNMRVRFEIAGSALGAGEQISTGSNVVYSDVSGVATSDYISGTRSSPTNGVTIKACYGVNDAAIANGACPQSMTAAMTVASQPLAITIGDNNELAKGTNNLTYIKKFDIAVADSAGNAVSGAVVSASVDITHYGKGANMSTATYAITGITAPYATISPAFVVTASPGAGRVWCPNEDFNRNGFLDTVVSEDKNGNGVLDAGEDFNGDRVLTTSLSEDLNGNGTLQPRKADVILSYIDSNTTGSNGRLNVQVEYPQNVATWLAFTVKATTNVAGSEGTDQKSYITTYVEGDQTNGSFLTAPYGNSSCVNAN